MLSLTVPQSFVARLSVAAACLLALGASHAATPADPFNYSRASSYTYDSQGRVSTETSEPDSPDHCVLTTFGYDPYGNRSQVKTEPCLSTSTAAKFAARQSDVVYNSQTYSYKDSSNTPVSVQLPAGMSPTDSYPVGNTVPADPLGRKLNQVFDPRFGVAVTVTDSANSLSTKIGLDDLGRKISEQRPDGSISYTWYCILADVAVSNFQSTNTVNVINASNTACAAPPAGESPTNAVMYVQTTQYTKNISGTYVPGPYSRVYSDRLGRTLRVATQSFDGASQPAGKSAASVVQDTIYNAYGVATVQTQPYFLSSKSSTLGGSNDRGLTKTVVDALGRPIEVYSTDAQGSQNVDFGAGLDASSFGTVKAARQLFSYVGLVVTTTNDKGQTRREEKNPLGELVRVTDVNGAQLVHQRDAFGNLVETKDALQNRIQISYDLRGNKIQMIDPDKGLLQYCYDALGQLKAQQNSTMRGNRTTPNACPSNTGTGTTAVSISEWTTFAYDTLGRMTQRIEPEGTSTWAYDKYADGTACSKGIGKLCEAKTSSPGMSRKVAYDSLGRTSKTLIDTGDGNKFASALDYDAQSGRLLTQTYPTGVKVGYSYTGQGTLEKVYLYNKVKISPLPNANNVTAAAVTLDVGATLWQAKQVNAWGQSEQQGYGNGVTTTASYEALTGRTSSLQASATGVSVISQSYSWDSNNNLTARSDAIGDGGGAVTETFVYGDQLNRLTSYTVSGPAVKNLTRTVYLSYNALGQLLYKSDVGLYTYGVSGKDTVRPHALTHLEGFAGAMPNTDYTYDLNGNLKTASAGKYRTLSYTSFDLPDSGAGIQGPSGTPKYTWTYDENHARIKEVRVIADGTSSAGTRTTWSLHPDNMGALSFEREVNDPTKPSASNPAQASNRHYISAGGQTVAVLVSTGDLPTNGSLTAAPTPTTASIDSATSAFKLVKMEYWHKDHLGSLVATTDQPATGVNVTVTARYAYDPFGKRRYSGGNYDVNGQIKGDWNPALNAGTDRGYTGHEHLDDVGVIHMNGRLFDPTLGIFMQADPHVTDPTDLQNYNRYGYCLNNPLTCTDPSGFDGVNIDNQTRLMTLDALIERATRLLAGPDIVISPPAPAYTPSYNITIGAGSAGASSPISNSGSYPGSSLEYFVYQFDQGHLGSGTFGLNNSINVNGGIGGITSGGSLTVITNCGFECASKMFGSTPQTPSPVSSSTGGGASSGGGSVYTPTPIAPTPPTPVPTQATAPSLGATGLSIGLDVLPFVGTAKSAIQLYNGYDLITGEPINPWMEAGGLFLGMVPGGKLLTKSDRIIDAAKGVDLTAEQLKNIRRFEKKLPANAKDSLSVRPLPNDGVVVQGTSPGRVPGSSAVYEKQIDAAGNTIQSTKTTYDPAGNIVHVKDKLNGGVFP